VRRSDRKNFPQEEEIVKTERGETLGDLKKAEKEKDHQPRRKNPEKTAPGLRKRKRNYAFGQRLGSKEYNSTISPR